MAQRIEDSKAKVKEFRNSRRVGPKNWGQQKGSSSQGFMRTPQKIARGLPQKRTGGFGTSSPAKRSVLSTPCGFCGRGNHAEKDYWRKISKCLACGSTTHSIKDCLKAWSEIQRINPEDQENRRKLG